MYGEPWLVVPKNEPAVCRLFRRHYSGRPSAEYRYGVTGPGESLVLLTPCERATIVWRRFDYAHSASTPYRGLFLVIFRNEGAGLSSDLLRAGEPIAWRKWDAERSMRTFVDASQVRSPNPGYCFKCAGWSRIGTTESRGLLVFAKGR